MNTLSANKKNSTYYFLVLNIKYLLTLKWIYVIYYNTNFHLGTQLMSLSINYPSHNIMTMIKHLK